MHLDAGLGWSPMFGSKVENREAIVRNTTDFKASRRTWLPNVVELIIAEQWQKAKEVAVRPSIKTVMKENNPIDSFAGARPPPKIRLVETHSGCALGC